MTVPAWLASVLPENTASVWERLAPLIPDTCYLAGGTAIAVHLRHRTSRDLDFFFHHSSVDLGALERTLSRAGAFAVERHDAGTLNGHFESTRLQFLHADEGNPSRLLAQPKEVEGLRVAEIPDLLAMKLKTILDRPEHRDYFDLRTIEERTPHSAEDGLAYFLERFQPSNPEAQLFAIIRALGYLGDVDEDEALPERLAGTARYWQRRQPEILKNAGWLTSGGTPPTPPHTT